MSTTAETLAAAKALVDTPTKWTQGAYARRSDRQPWSSGHSDATCFCVLGAVSRVRPVEPQICRLLRAALPSHFTIISNFNDHPETRHTDVMALFDRAIALAEAEGV